MVRQLEEIKKRNNGSKGKIVQRTEIKFNDDVRALMRQHKLPKNFASGPKLEYVVVWTNTDRLKQLFVRGKRDVFRTGCGVVENQ